MIKKIKLLFSRINKPVYRLVYHKETTNKTEIYFLVAPKMVKNFFGNQKLRIARKGFKSVVTGNRPNGSIRSFNYDGIISCTKLGLLEEIN